MTDKAGCSRGRRSSGGFTILEVLLAVLVLSVGFIGVFGMQTVAIQTSRAGTDLRMATELAETTLERFQKDAMSWGQSGNPGDWGTGTWLRTALGTAGDDDAWAWPPTPQGVSNRVPAFNGLGLAERDTGSALTYTNRNNRFCVDYQADWLRGASFARVTVRVRWPRNVAGQAGVSDDCARLWELEDAILARDFYEVRVTGIVRANL
jgi:type II secretory pathway pseudopilin PulG